MWRIVVLALSVLFAGVAYSKEHPNPETTETKKAPEDEQRGSDKSPFTVKVLPTPDAEAKAAKEEGHRQEKARGYIQDPNATGDERPGLGCSSVEFSAADC